MTNPLITPTHYPAQCTTLLLSVPLADLAYALMLRLAGQGDIDPRDRLHLLRLARVLPVVAHSTNGAHSPEATP